jgi:ribosomal protein L11 methyltransferase
MPYHQLVLDVRGTEVAAAEDACAALGAMALSLADGGNEPLLEPAPGATPLWRDIELRALFAADANPGVLAATLAATLGLPAESIRVESVADRPWEREWLKDFHPMRFGRRLWVCPAGQLPDRPGAIVLELDPGLAFGTGNHATTALCLEWLDGCAIDGLDVLDYGCGSGILALAALKLGARRATCVDIDPQARRATRENASKNALFDRIAVHDAASRIAGPYDLVLANILSQPLIELASRLAALCRRGGTIVLAGMLARDARDVAEAYRPWFDIGAAAEREGWTLLAGGRRAE